MAPGAGSIFTGWTGMWALSGRYFHTTNSMERAITENIAMGPASPMKGRMNSGARNGPITVPRPKAPARLDMAVVRSATKAR